MKVTVPDSMIPALKREKEMRDTEGAFDTKIAAKHAQMEKYREKIRHLQDDVYELERKRGLVRGEKGRYDFPGGYHELYDSLVESA